MGLLTIGAFAKASRLSPKALRLYGELGLLPPARVDPVTGYRLYAPGQLEQARLVAWLRRLGMPLARIRDVTAMDGPAAAREVEAFWAEVENDVAARRGMAAFLVDHLSRREGHMPNHDRPLAISYAALSDTGLVRQTNQDAAYAGSRLLAVADGFGRGGAPASTAAVETLRRLETDGALTDTLSAADLLNVLEERITQAGRAVSAAAAPGAGTEEAGETGEAVADDGARGRAVPGEALDRPGDGQADGPRDEAGTTLTAMLWAGSRLALVHIGDSRAYLLREGGFFQITHDHTLVQQMVDEGRITAEEAASHPQRALLIRALGAARETRPDVRLQDARPGDRYLLCSDGLTSVVPSERVREAVAGGAAPEETVRELVRMARQSGGPDNVSCVVADVRAA